MLEENGPVEKTQWAIWALAILASLVGIRTGRHWRDRWFAAWLAIMGAMAILRESDAHLWFDPRRIGEWGMRLATRWWISPETPVLPRIVWGAVLLAILVGALLPILSVRPHWITLLRARDRAWLLLVLGTGALFVGYACDDLIGRGQFVPHFHTQIAEESFELLGAILFAVAIILHTSIPLTARERAARESIAAN